MKRATSAYTLVEIIVVIAIMAVIMGISLAGWTNYQNMEKLRTQTQEIVTWLRKIHTKAAQGEKPSANCASLDFYQIRQSGNNLNAYANCLDASGSTLPEKQLETIEISSNISLRGVDPFVFQSGTGITGVTEDFILEYDSRTTTVTITRSGKISWQMN